MYLYLLNLTALLWMTELKFPGAPSLSLDFCHGENEICPKQMGWATHHHMLMPLWTSVCSSPSLPVPVDPLCSDPRPVPWGWSLAAWRTSCLKCSLCSELFTSPINITVCCIISLLKLTLIPGFPSAKTHFLASSMAKLPLRAGGALSPRLPFSLAQAPNRPWSPLHCYPIRHSQQTLSSGPQHGRQNCHCPP